jgi:hypothetical protein
MGTGRTAFSRLIPSISRRSQSPMLLRPKSSSPHTVAIFAAIRARLRLEQNDEPEAQHRTANQQAEAEARA